MSFEWIANHLALDFVNTVSWGDPDTPNERFVDYAALVAWAVEGGVLTPAAARRFEARAARTPAAGSRAVNRARRVRIALYGIFSSVARDEPVPPGALAGLNQALEGLSLRIETDRTQTFRWQWSMSPGTDRMDVFLDPVLWAAAELLVDSQERNRMKICANDRCGWLFVDSSRRGNRRWCDMRDCGNRAKARRYYRRHHPAP